MKVRYKVSKAWCFSNGILGENNSVVLVSFLFIYMRDAQWNHAELGLMLLLWLDLAEGFRSEIILVLLGWLCRLDSAEGLNQRSVWCFCDVININLWFRSGVSLMLQWWFGRLDLAEGSGLGSVWLYRLYWKFRSGISLTLLYWVSRIEIWLKV